MARKKNYEVQRFFPATDTQSLAQESWKDDKNLVLLGYAGTGKTHVALSLGISEVAAGKADGLVIVRSAVSTRDQGFMPGDPMEKLEMYAGPYIGIINSIVKTSNSAQSPWKELTREGVIEFESTSFLRGINLDDKIVVVDECQNMSFHELDTIITRVGENARIIFSGDRIQTDLKAVDEKNGLGNFLSIIDNMPEYFDIFRFGIDDIIRSKMMKEYIIERTHQFPDL